MEYFKMIKHIWLSLLIVIISALGITAQAATRITYLHHDNLGSPVAATDESGAVLWRETYAPFGEKSVKSESASNERIGYTGKLHSNGTGLVYMNARYYDPEVGRFMAVDPIDATNGGVAHFNRYAYAYNNPYRYIDPSGLEGQCTVNDQDGDGVPDSMRGRTQADAYDFDGWVTAPVAPHNSVAALSIEFGFPGLITASGGPEMIDLGLNFTLATSVLNGVYDYHFNVAPTAGGSIGLIAGTAQLEVFSGTYQEYKKSLNPSLYWSAGGGLLVTEDNKVKGFTVGTGFGGQWMEKFKYTRPLKGFLHKGYTASDDVDL